MVPIKEFLKNYDTSFNHATMHDLMLFTSE